MVSRVEPGGGGMGSSGRSSRPNKFGLGGTKGITDPWSNKPKTKSETKAARKAIKSAAKTTNKPAKIKDRSITLYR